MAHTKPFPLVRVILSVVVLVIATVVLLQYRTSVLSAEEATLRGQFVPDA
jgi:hypothetical protein